MLNNKRQISNEDIINIAAWAMFFLGLFVNNDLSILGAILGFIYYKKTGNKWSMIANIALFGFVFVLAFIVGFFGALM